MKKLANALFAIGMVSVVVLLTGCDKEIMPDRVEINKMMVINAAGVDKGIDDPENVRVTIVARKICQETSQKTSGEQSNPKSIILSNEDKTFSNAIRNFQTFMDKKMFWGHVEYYIIGEEAAKEGIPKYLDFLTRDHEVRGTSKIYIVQGSTAKEFIEQSSLGDIFMPDHLDSIGQNSKQVTGAKELELSEFMHWLNDKYSSAVVPTLYLTPKEDGMEEGEEQKTIFDLGGYGIVKNLKLVTILDKQMTRGENFLLNRVITGSIQVEDLDGKMVGLELVNSRAKMKPEFEDGKLKQLKVEVKLSSNIDEVHATTSIFSKESLEHIQEEQSKVVKQEIEQVIAYAQKENADFIDVANYLESKHPTKWKKYKDDWDTIFPQIPIVVEVQSRINRSYDVREPSGVLEEEHK